MSHCNICNINISNKNFKRHESSQKYLNNIQNYVQSVTKLITKHLIRVYLFDPKIANFRIIAHQTLKFEIFN